MATTSNEPGQWRTPWDSTTRDLLNMFPDSLLSLNGSMTMSQSGFWDLSGPAVEADGTIIERRFSDASQCSDDYCYIERQQSDSSLEHTFDPSQNPDCGETDTSLQTGEADPRHNWPSASTRKRRKGDIPDTSISNSHQPWSSTRPAKSHRDRERNRVAAAKCRQKAKQSVSELQNRERELLQQNRYLTAHARSLREEVINLKNEILRHSHCDSDVIQSYINKAARDIR